MELERMLEEIKKIDSNNILTFGNPKLDKGIAMGYHTAGIHLSPSDKSGIMNVCPRATDGCRAACLDTAGRGGIGATNSFETTNNVQKCRIRRTWLFKLDPIRFRKLAKKALKRHLLRCIKLQVKAAIRPNLTSDLLKLVKMLDEIITELLQELKAEGLTVEVQLYDYSKNGISSSRVKDILGLQNRYKITHSFSEKMSIEKVRKLTGQGDNVAVVFRAKELPKSWEGIEVINGDDHDLRFLDKAGVIVGLIAKGKAKKDRSGFTVAA